MEIQLEGFLEALGCDGSRWMANEMSKVFKHLIRGYLEDPEEIIQPHNMDRKLWVTTAKVSGPFTSVCRKHCFPFIGRYRIEVTLNKQILTAGKLSQLVECLACRFQTLDELGREIADSLSLHLNATGICVEIHVESPCVGCGPLAPTDLKIDGSPVSS